MSDKLDQKIDGLRADLDKFLHNDLAHLKMDVDTIHSKVKEVDSKVDKTSSIVQKIQNKIAFINGEIIVLIPLVFTILGLITYLVFKGQ